MPKTQTPVPVPVLNFQKEGLFWHQVYLFIYLFALIFFFSPQAVSFYLSLLCSAVSITLCYQRASVEVLLPSFKSQWASLLKAGGNN